MESYQMDVFLEQIVQKKSTPVDLLKKVGLIVAALLVGFIAILVLPAMDNAVGMIFRSFGFLLFAGAIYGAYFLISSMNIEYEYIMTNGEIDIDKIIARKRRKRLITIDARHFTEFGAYKDVSKGSETTFMACTSPDDEDTYYAKLNHTKHGDCMVVFNPNERILKSIKQYAKRQVMR